MSSSLQFIDKGAAAASPRRLRAAAGNEARARRAACVFQCGPSAALLGEDARLGQTSRVFRRQPRARRALRKT